MQEEIRSVLKPRKAIGFYLHANWIFSSLIEKLGLLIMMGLAWWKIWGFFF